MPWFARAPNITLRARDLRCVQRISLFTLTTTYMPVARATLDNWAPQYDPSVRARRAPPQLRACVPQPLLLATFDTYLVAHEYLCRRLCVGQCDTALPCLSHASLAWPLVTPQILALNGCGYADTAGERCCLVAFPDQPCVGTASWSVRRSGAGSSCTPDCVPACLPARCRGAGDMLRCACLRSRARCVFGPGRPSMVVRLTFGLAQITAIQVFSAIFALAYVIGIPVFFTYLVYTARATRRRRRRRGCDDRC